MIHKIKVLVFLVVIITSPVIFANTLPGVIDKTKKSVVAVGTYMAKRSPKSVFLGTGFAVVDGSLIVTNAHVLPKQIDNKSYEQLSVFIRHESKIRLFSVKTVAVDKTHDLAVLKISSGSLPPLKIESGLVREGHSIAFTGFPIGMVLGLYPVTHQGIISAITPIAIPMLRARQLNAKALRRLKDPYEVYQLDGTAYPGNSGSPVYDQENGKVIGIINKVFVKESKENLLSKPSGITYAIPVKYLYDLLKQNNLI